MGISRKELQRRNVLRNKAKATWKVGDVYELNEFAKGKVVKVNNKTLTIEYVAFGETKRVLRGF